MTSAALVIRCVGCGENVAGYDAARSRPVDLGKAIQHAARDPKLDAVLVRGSEIRISLGACACNRNPPAEKADETDEPHVDHPASVAHLHRQDFKRTDRHRYGKDIQED